ncbi:unnamed protein product [Adineta ricciae]|uniref:G-protein coupled receptors family 1 profile domain-containing protein n=1 Tax=Adineta ricciae TaxID=249248 RepID=A0A815BR34_ADIRI|nr:unnamed protein product [Adineta ricciae]CAF1373683.1 unnamed protein product [Adineta ricciae]
MPSTTQRDPTLALITRVLTYYGYSIMLIFGNIGNIFNIILFLQKKLRKISCNNYFLVTALTNIIALNVGISTLIHAESEPSDITTTYCKIDGYIMNVCLQVSRYLIVIACFDRYAMCSTNAFIRKFSRVRIARRYVIPCVVFIWMVVPIHVPILITAQNSTCTFVDKGAFYNSIYGLLLIGILPPVLMFVFSLLIFHNLKLRQHRRQIHPVVTGQLVTPIHDMQRLKTKDQQVFAMLLVQVFAYVASSTPYTITLLYVVLKSVVTVEETTVDAPTTTFILFVTDMLRFVCPFTSFYLFLFVSQLYRREMVLIIRKILHYSRLLLHPPHTDNLDRAGSQHHRSST